MTRTSSVPFGVPGKQEGRLYATALLVSGAIMACWSWSPLAAQPPERSRPERPEERLRDAPPPRLREEVPARPRDAERRVEAGRHLDAGRREEGPPPRVKDRPGRPDGEFRPTDGEFRRPEGEIRRPDGPRLPGGRDIPVPRPSGPRGDRPPGERSRPPVPDQPPPPGIRPREAGPPEEGPPPVRREMRELPPPELRLELREMDERIRRLEWQVQWLRQELRPREELPSRLPRDPAPSRHIEQRDPPRGPLDVRPEARERPSGPPFRERAERPRD